MSTANSELPNRTPAEGPAMSGFGTDVASDDLCPVSSCLTPAGRGAVAVIAVRGPVSLFDGVRPADSPPEAANLTLPAVRTARLFTARNGRPASEQRVGSVLLGTWRNVSPATHTESSSGSAAEDLKASQSAEEEVVFARVSDDVVEVNCHGGPQAVQRILADLRAVGCEVISAEEWEQREQGILYSESRSVAAECVTSRTAVFAMQQVENLCAVIAELSRQSFDTAARSIERMLSWWSWAEHLAAPWQVVLIGRPNVGKSSLMNAILGRSRSIISPQPGTTRDVVTGVTSIDGWPIEFSDTAGLRETGDVLESAGQELARLKLAHANLVLLLLDGSEPPQHEDWQLMQETRPATDSRDELTLNRRRILVVNKFDQVSDPLSFPSGEWTAIANEPDAASLVRISCVTHAGLDDLLQRIVSMLIPAVPQSTEPFPINARQTQLLREIRLACLKCDAVGRDQLLDVLQNSVNGAP